MKIGRCKANDLSWNMWRLLTGIGEGQLSCPLYGQKVHKQIAELRKYPRWLWMVGMVPKNLRTCLQAILEEHTYDGEVETCTWRHGAKMGIGQNKGCDCDV